jgi:hypothetical protein
MLHIISKGILYLKFKQNGFNKENQFLIRNKKCDANILINELNS